MSESDQQAERPEGERSGSEASTGVPVGRGPAAPTRLDLTPAAVVLGAFAVAILIGGLIMLATGANPVVAYAALLEGAFGGGARIATTLARATPFLGASLALAFAFRAGLFNIGAEGQLLIGALFAGWAGTWSWLEGLPALVVLPIVLISGAVGGAIYGGIPGVLKARTGAHEVIVTIMLNTIAIRLLDWLVLSRDPVILLDTTASVPHSRAIADAARLPAMPGAGDSTLHTGLLLGIAMCALMWFVVERTTTGFEIKTVGLSASSATYAGMSVPRTWVLVMAGSGAFAGLAGAAEVSGSIGYIQPGTFRNIGFDSIAIALLARGNPWGIIPASLLWGALLTGAPLMQLKAGVDRDIVLIVQALILLFVAADVIIRRLFRIRDAGGPRASLASGWGG